MSTHEIEFKSIKLKGKPFSILTAFSIYNFLVQR